MSAVSLTSMAGAQGELIGVTMIRAYHESRGDTNRTEIIIPDAAHGTNPATAVMCGYKVIEIPTGRDGDVDMDALKAAVGPRTAGLMLTNPSTLGVFEKKVAEMSRVVHEVGGLLYYDGANLNALLAKVKPGDMGFDVIHMNLHKTFSTPHGGGGPGSAPVGVGERLLPYLPVPIVAYEQGVYHWLTEKDRPQSIGRLSAHMGNAGVLLRAYIYVRLLGVEGMSRISEYATLNANYLMAELRKAGFDLGVTNSAVTPVFLKGSLGEATNITMDMRENYGIFCSIVVYPVVPREVIMLRLIPTSVHTLEDVEYTIETFKKVKVKLEAGEYEASEIVNWK